MRFGTVEHDLLRHPFALIHPETTSDDQDSMNLILIAAMNPLPCGHRGDPRRDCTCTPGAVVATRSGSQLGTSG
jgi:hypothetical protein